MRAHGMCVYIFWSGGRRGMVVSENERVSYWPTSVSNGWPKKITNPFELPDRGQHHP